jgi:predicted ester cyclase
MSIRELEVLEHRWIKEWNKGKAAIMGAIDELVAIDYVEHDGTGEETHGLKDYKKSISELFSAFPDIHLTLDDMVVEGDKVVARFTFSGTHKGVFMGMPPTNKKWTMWGIYIDRIAGGKFVESWVRYDTMGFMQQLDLVTTPKKG